MSVHDILSSPNCNKIYQEVRRYTDKIMSEYIEEIRSGIGYRDNKEIYDTVWGTVEFNVGEMVILDSPILQRLRKIKQLGLASFVYCSSDYSRFAHTIGVVYLAGRMANRIYSSARKPVLDSMKINPVQVTRLAAIFHDIGHMFFSHVSEQYFINCEQNPRYREVKKMLKHIRNTMAPNAALHEVIGAMMIHSITIKSMLMIVTSKLDDIDIEEETVDRVVDYISCLILGVANDSFILPYSTIINGPIDADKCDYLSRDSHATKVPVSVDFSRLIQKLQVVPAYDISKTDIWNVDSSGDTYLFYGYIKENI